MATTGWGTGTWGTGSWSTGGPGTLTIDRAVPLGPTSLRVFVSKELRALSSIATGDATNPRSWSVQRLDTNAFLTVLSATVANDLLSADLQVLQKLSSWPQQVRVSGVGLLDKVGGLLGSPSSADAPGMEKSPPLLPTSQVEDLANPQFDTDLQVGGTLRVDGSGDYVRHAGVEFLRKLILRRLVTGRGGFFHLPDYGMGIQVKQPLTGSDLVKLQAEVQRQVLNEPEFLTARATLELDAAKNLLTITVRAVLSQTNQEVTIPVEAVLDSAVTL